MTRSFPFAAIAAVGLALVVHACGGGSQGDSSGFGNPVGRRGGPVGAQGGMDGGSDGAGGAAGGAAKDGPGGGSGDAGGIDAAGGGGGIGGAGGVGGAGGAGGAGGGGGAGGAGGGGAGGAGGGGTGVDAPAGKDGPPESVAADTGPEIAIGECSDFDKNGVLDCKETLVANPDFKSDGLSWTAEYNALATWKAMDAEGYPKFGSVTVTNTTLYAGPTLGSTSAVQCVDVGPADYSLYAHILLPPGQSGSGQAAVMANFYSLPGCAGPSGGAYRTPVVDATTAGPWRESGGAFSAPAGMKSMAIRLVVMKAVSAPAVSALFDDILLKAR